jgi:hypothetical protein
MVPHFFDAAPVTASGLTAARLSVNYFVAEYVKAKRLCPEFNHFVRNQDGISPGGIQHH